jgi:spore photoproduct lyase
MPSAPRRQRAPPGRSHHQARSAIGAGSPTACSSRRTRSRSRSAARWWARAEALGVAVEPLRTNRVVGLGRAGDARATYRAAKRTLALVNAPAGQLALQPIPPSADWQFHLAQGCPAHCQYCYLAGSLAGAPVVRAYANLPAILGNLPAYVSGDAAAPTSFEASCYTDPLAVEHLTGSLEAAIRWFGTRP